MSRSSRSESSTRVDHGAERVEWVRERRREGKNALAVIRKAMDLSGLLEDPLHDDLVVLAGRVEEWLDRVRLAARFAMEDSRRRRGLDMPSQAVATVESEAVATSGNEPLAGDASDRSRA
jgi:hypothetical protein